MLQNILFTFNVINIIQLKNQESCGSASVSRLHTHAFASHLL